jgi:hypothetical protein
MFFFRSLFMLSWAGAPPADFQAVDSAHVYAIDIILFLLELLVAGIQSAGSYLISVWGCLFPVVFFVVGSLFCQPLAVVVEMIYYARPGTSLCSFQFRFSD